MKHPYLNEYDPDHFTTPRRLTTPLSRDEPLLSDFGVLVGVIVCFLAALALLWWQA